MTLKDRVKKLESCFQKTGTPQAGRVFICETDEQLRQAEAACAALPECTPSVIVVERDMSLPRPLPKDEK